jgi:type I restriction enzyme, S subunit
MSGALKPYPRYKESGVEWLGAVPEGWEVVRLRFLADLNPSPTEIDDTDEEKDVQFLPMEAVGDDGSLSLEQLRPIAAVKSGYTYFAEGDVTYAKITPCFENGKGAILQGLNGGFGFGSTELTILRPRNRIDRRFLWQITASRAFRSLGESYMYGAGGQKRVPNDFARNLPIPLPPLPEQQAIADYLDAETQRIDTLIAELREMIRLLKEKRQALISHCVTKGLDPTAPMKDSGVEWLGEVPEGWEVGPLKHFSRIVDCKHVTATFVEDGYPVVSIREVQSRYVDIANANRTDRLGYESLISDGRIPRMGDLIISRNATLGEAAEVDRDQLPLAMGQDVSMIQPAHDAATGSYLYFCLKSDYARAQIDTLSVGSTFRRINVEQIRSLLCAIPPLPEQHAIAAHLDTETAKIDRLISETEDTITLMQERRSALISSVVTGKLQVPGIAEPSGSTLNSRPENLS